jgi:hypothetical protein
MTLLRVSIIDAWSGYSPTAPHSAEWHLNASSAHFLGHAVFTVGQDPLLREQHDVTIPAEDVERLYRTVLACPRKAGEYVPKFTHTDGCPSFQMMFEAHEGTVVLQSTSQGEGHVPWQLIDLRGSFVTASRRPWHAYQRMWPHLGRARLADLVRRHPAAR